MACFEEKTFYQIDEACIFFLVSTLFLEIIRDILFWCLYFDATHTLQLAREEGKL